MIDLDKLQRATNKLADVIEILHKKMEGRGIYPAEAPLVILKLREVEQKLRMIGANEDNPIPYDVD